MNSRNSWNSIVSVILPVFNEKAIVKDVLESLLAQHEEDFSIEILVVDGMSTDGSEKIVAEMAKKDSRVKLLQNEKRRTPFAFNLGLEQATGDYICILGAHCVYARDYIAVCLSELLDKEAVGCSGRVITKPHNKSIEARLAYWVMSHPFGVSNHSYRTQSEGYVDTIPYPVFRKSALLEVGGYDETLLRNQDNDMNYKLRKTGYKLYCTWKTHLIYYARSTIRSAMNYAFSSGSWCSANYKNEPKSLGLRHYIPFVFVLSVLGGILFGMVSSTFANWNLLYIWVISLFPIILHLFLGSIFSVQLLMREHKVAVLLMPFVFLAFHVLYGIGFLIGLFRNVA